MKFNWSIFLLLFIGIITNASAQKLNYEISDNAGKMFDLKNYWRAKELYRQAYKKDLTNVKNKYRFGVCLVYSYDRENAIKTLEAVSKKPSCPAEVWYHLARAYHLTNHYDKAITTYKKYINTNGAKQELIIAANRNIEMCNNAKILIKTPISVTFENLGKKVNTKGMEYLPTITNNEGLLIYTTRREGTTGRIYDLEGYYTADIYMSKFKYGKWSKARSLGPPNSYGNEQTAGISGNGKSILYYVNNPNSKNNLQLSIKGKKSFKRSIEIKSKKVNENSSKQISAAISNDGNMMIFSSDRALGIGKQDLFIAKKLPNGEWGEPENLGGTINTSYDECYPYLINDGNTLYFASKGHNSIGGFDIFKSDYDSTEKSWSSPKNIGYPLNTPDDNLSICFSGNKKYAYISAYRNDSEGDLDIYRVNFNDAVPDYTTIKGVVVDADSNSFNQPLTIEVFDKKSAQLYGIYEVNQSKGSYIMILPPNQYELNIDVSGKGYFKKTFLVQGQNYYKKEVNRNILVTFSPD